MGYSTHFYLKDIIIPKDSKFTKVQIKKDIRKDDWGFGFYEINTEEPRKWYDFKRDMKNFSLKYKDVLFKTYGEGEENGDIWYRYFKNGKMQECFAKVVFEVYDESKLV